MIFGFIFCQGGLIGFAKIQFKHLKFGLVVKLAKLFFLVIKGFLPELKKGVLGVRFWKFIYWSNVWGYFLIEVFSYYFFLLHFLLCQFVNIGQYKIFPSGQTKLDEKVSFHCTLS